MIAISYRVSDSAAYAGRIYSHLTRHFREDEIFLDVEALTIGSVFPDELKAVFGFCDVALIIIGPNWAIDPNGVNRLENDDDWVRGEVRAALHNSKTLVVPILVSGATMPSQEILPIDIRQLHSIQAVDVRHKTFKKDMENVVECIHQHLDVDDFYDVITQQQTLGIVRTVKGFPNDKFKYYAEKAERIRILQTWIPDAVALTNAIRGGVEKGATVEILFLDPDSVSLAERCKALGLPIEVIQSEMNASKYRLLMLHNNIDKTNGGNIEVRLYDSLPSMRMYMCDETAYVSFLLFGKQASGALNLEIRDSDTEWHKLIISEFVNRWDSANHYLNFETGEFTRIE